MIENIRPEIEKALVDLDRQAATIQQAWLDQFPPDEPPPNIYAAVDDNGNYILVPILIAKANLLVVLANLDKE